MRRSLLLIAAALLSACAPPPTPFRATLPPNAVTAPVYTAIPTLTLSPSPLPATATPTDTPSPSAVPLPSQTPTPSGTPPLWTPTPPLRAAMPPEAALAPAPLAAAEGWSCGDFPCEDDLDGFRARIQVPPGFRLEHVGRFPAQPQQITYGPDGRLYATTIETPARTGAVYALNSDGTTERYSGDFVSPVGLAFQPGTDILYVSARVTLESGGGLWRVPAGGGAPEAVLTTLPCCFMVIDNQPNGLIFGPDGYLYMGIGSLTDRAEPRAGERTPYTALNPLEAAVLRINPHTGEAGAYASGLRNPFDIAIDSSGQFFATDSGLVTGEGDRLLRVERARHYGWPYWRLRGCDECPPSPPALDVAADMLTFPAYTLPRGLVVYHGASYPANFYDHLFVALWNGVEGGQRVVHIDPALARPEPFVTGLIRPIDVTVDPSGALVVADFIYGHVWRVVYEGG